jgi:hypothetical protein
VFRDFIRDSLGSLKGRKPWFFFCPYVLFWEGSSGIPHGQKSVSSEINAGFLPPSSNGFILLDGGWWRWQGIIYCLNLHLFALASLVNKSLVSARRVPRNNRKVEVCASLSRLVAKRWESIWGLSSIRRASGFLHSAIFWKSRGDSKRPLPVSSETAMNVSRARPSTWQLTRSKVGDASEAVRGACFKSPADVVE